MNGPYKYLENRRKCDTFTWINRILILLFIVALLFFLFFFVTKPRAVMADEVTLSWDANDSTPDGYLIYQRIDGSEYDYTTAVCDTVETTCTISDLSPGIQYYFVARAYVGENTSADSNEVGYVPEIQVPQNFKIVVELSFEIDENGNASIASAEIK